MNSTPRNGSAPAGGTASGTAYARTEDGITTRVSAQAALDEGRAAMLDRVTVRAQVRTISRDGGRYDITYTDGRHVVLLPIATPRLDHLAAYGTDQVFARVRLADGHALTVKIRPGADWAEEVFPHGLDVPDTEPWENEDFVEGWSTGGNAEDGSLYLGVPVQAIRDLIVQHGGEHADQD